MKKQFLALILLGTCVSGLSAAAGTAEALEVDQKQRQAMEQHMQNLQRHISILEDYCNFKTVFALEIIYGKTPKDILYDIANTAGYSKAEIDAGIANNFGGKTGTFASSKGESEDALALKMGIDFYLELGR